MNIQAGRDGEGYLINPGDWTDDIAKEMAQEGAFAAFLFAEMNTYEAGNTACWTKAQTYLALGNALLTLTRLEIDSTPLWKV